MHRCRYCTCEGDSKSPVLEVDSKEHINARSQMLTHPKVAAQHAMQAEIRHNYTPKSVPKDEEKSVSPDMQLAAMSMQLFVVVGIRVKKKHP